MASLKSIVHVGICLHAIAKYAEACEEKLARYPDADRDWLLSRAPNLDNLVDDLRKACEAACEETKTT